MPNPTKNNNDVPEDLKERKESKIIAAEAAAQKMDEKISPSEAFLSAIGYISFLCILPLVIFPKSKFAQYHGKQALVLAIFLYFLDILQIFPARFSAMYLAFRFILVIGCMAMTLKGRFFRLPLVYDLSERFQIAVKS